MSMPEIVITNRVFDETKALLAERCRLICNDDPAAPLDRDGLVAAARDADALMAFMTDRVDAALLDACPRLGIVAGALKGHDNFDVDACTARGVYLTVVPDLLTRPTAELAVGLLIASARHIVAADAHVRAGGYTGWRPAFYGTGLADSTVGIVGFGAVGRATAQRLQGFEARLLVTDEPAPDPADAAAVGAARAPLDDLVRESDFIILAAPLTERTLGLFDRERLAAVKPGARLINPARGSVVDEGAVAEALADGRLAGYAADVFEMEDWARADRPETIHPNLIADPARTVLTPHIGSAVTEVRRRIERAAAENILDYLDGRVPRGAVNAPRPRAAAGAGC